MRHGKHTFKVGRTSSHRRCMIANMLKSLIDHERIETTLVKAKELRRHADRMVTLAKRGTLGARRKAIAELMIRYNTLTPQQARDVKKTGNTACYNTDRRVVKKLFEGLAQRFATRPGGYTRILKLPNLRAGDAAETCIIEYLSV